MSKQHYSPLASLLIWFSHSSLNKIARTQWNTRFCGLSMWPICRQAFHFVKLSDLCIVSGGIWKIPKMNMFIWYTGTCLHVWRIVGIQSFDWIWKKTRIRCKIIEKYAEMWASLLLWSSCLVLAFCSRGLVIPMEHTISSNLSTFRQFFARMWLNLKKNKNTRLLIQNIIACSCSWLVFLLIYVLQK